MKKIKKKSAPSAETGKTVYVKPTIQVYEMEVEEGLMLGVSDAKFGGDYEREASAPARHCSWGNILEDEETM